MPSVIFRSAMRFACLSFLICGLGVAYAPGQPPALTLAPTITTLAGVNGSHGDSGSPLPAAGSVLNVPVGIATDAAGNVYFADSGNQVIRRVDVKTGMMTIFAGTNGVSGFVDHVSATSASLNHPLGVRFDDAGNLYISDAGNFVVRRVDAMTGAIATIAGTPGAGGYTGDNGAATSAKLGYPQLMAFDRAGSLYIADSTNNVIRKVSGGVITTIAGTGIAGFSGDLGQAALAQLNYPSGVSFDAAGNLYICDRNNHVVRRVAAATGVISSVAGVGGSPGNSGDFGPATSALLNYPAAVEADSGGDLYITDYANSAIRYVNFTTGVITTIAGVNGTPGYSGDGGAATSALLTNPVGVALDRRGNLYLSDAGSSTTRAISLRPTFPATVVGSTSVAQNVIVHINQGVSIANITVPGSQGGAQEYNLGSMSGCIVDGVTVNAAGMDCSVPVTFSPAYPGSRGIPLVAYTSAGIFKFGMTGVGMGPQAGFTPATITTVAGRGYNGFQGDGGPATSAQLGHPDAVTADREGNLYISDLGNSVVRRVDGNTQIISTFAGTALQPGFSGDGGTASSALIHDPAGLIVDSASNLYFTDQSNMAIRKVDTASGLVTAVAGVGGSEGYSGDGGPAGNAQLSRPSDQAIDSAENLYIVDTGNSVVRKVDAKTGIITTVAGTGLPGYSGDGGPATNAQLSYPNSVVIDAADNVYILDNNNYVVRRIAAASGIISVVAGMAGSPGYSGDGGPATSARLAGASGMALDSAGNLYITDTSNNVIRKINSSTGVITTIAGNRVQGYSGDGGPATAAALYYPNFPVVDSLGSLYFADDTNNVIRKVDGVEPMNFGVIQVNTSSNELDVTLTNNGNAPLTLSALNLPPDYNLQGAATTCTAFTSLAPAASCILGVKFAPTVLGNLNESMTLVDNQGTQTLPLVGSSISRVPTTTTLTTVPAQPYAGESLALIATITPTPTGPQLGYVNFYYRLNGMYYQLGFAYINPSGVASLNLSSISTNGYLWTAQYSGNATSTGSLSPEIQVDVVPAAATATTLSITPGNNVMAGSALALTATVSSFGSPVYPGAVAFCDATAASCDGTGLLGISQLTSGGVASLKFVPGAGTYSIKAVYAGLGVDAPSLSSTQTLIVSGDGGYRTFTSIGATGVPGDYTLTGTVSAFGILPPSGPVSFVATTAANVSLGSATLDFATLDRAFIPSIVPSLNQNSIAWAATGDFNGDGIPDLVVTNNHDLALVLLGAGDGTFLPPVPYAVASSPQEGNPGFVTVADLNHDGNPDIIVADSLRNDVAILLGNGDGTFQPYTTLATGNQPSFVAVADLNGDGLLDLVVANAADSTVGVLLGHGDGTFQTQATYPTGATNGIAIADFNHDGIPDLAVTNAAAGQLPGTVSLLIGVGNGGFNTAQTLFLPDGVSPSVPVAVDLRKIGILDLVFADNVASRAYVMLGRNDGTFAAPASYVTQTSARSLSVGDINNDKILDLVVPDGGGTGVSILLGRGDGTFGISRDYPTPGSSPSVVALADFNGDGLLDISTANTGSVNVSVLLQQQTMTATLTGAAASGPTAQLAAAVYAGDASHAASLSTTTQLQPVLVATGLTVFPNPAQPGTIVTLAAMITPVPTGGISGTVGFFNGTTLLGTSPVNSLGLATLAIGNLPTGDNSITAVYSGTAILASATSAAIIETVGKSSITVTTTVTNTQGTLVYGQQSLVATTLSGFGSANASGTVTYILTPAVIAPQTVTNGKVPSFALPSLPPGIYTLAVNYSGDQTNAAAGEAITFTVTAPQLVLTVTNSNRPYGTGNPAFAGTVTGAVNGDVFTEDFTTAATMPSIAGTYAILPAATGAHVADYTILATNGILTVTQAGSSTTLSLPGNLTVKVAAALVATVSSLTSGMPTGAVTFYSGSTVLGTTNLGSDGTATYSLTPAATGVESLSAVYAGDNNFTPSASASAAVTVNPNFTITAPTAPVTLVSGGAVAIPINIPPLGGAYNSLVTMSATGLPAGAVATFNPATLMPGSAGAATTMTIQLAQQKASTPLRNPPGSPLLPVLPAVGTLAGVLAMAARRRRLPLAFMVAIAGMVFTTAGLTTGCSGASWSSAPSTSGPPTSPASQTYAITVTGTSGALHASTTFSLVVQ